MDLTTMLVTAILLTIVSLPFVLAYRNKRKQENKIYSELHALANRNFCQLNEKEYSGNSALGLDREQGKLLYVRIAGNEIKTKAIILSEYKTSNVRCTYKASDSGKENEIIENISLVFEPRSAQSGTQSVELFSSSANTVLDDELNLAKKWSKRINEDFLTRP